MVDCDIYQDVKSRADCGSLGIAVVEHRIATHRAAW
jgi:hypothetical protein